MTNDKTRPEGPPAADPIRQETGGQEPPAADQASAEPVKKRGRPKKKKIIVITGNPHMTDERTTAEGQGPNNWQDMTPHEFMEYAHDNPEAARQDVKDYFSTGKGKEAADNLITAARTLQETAEALTSARNIVNETGARIVARRMAEAQFDISKIVDAIVRANRFSFLTSDADAEALDKFDNEWDELEPFINAILDGDPARKGMTAEQLLDSIPVWGIYHIDNMEGIDEKAQDAQEAADIKAVIEIIKRARAARDQAATEAIIKAQQAGRDQRRQIKENAMKSGAIMGLQTGNLITFSERDLWDAFAPGKISKIGTLARDEIDDETGQVIKNVLEKGEIMPVSAIEVSYKALFLLNTILANSVENYRERFVKDGAITFYVKGVLDSLDIDPRIKDDGQLDINRKTAGVIYLEKQFAPLLQFIGTIPGGSRYSVFSYDGYDADTDTMTVKIPYLFQLWKRTQTAYSQRKAAKQERIDAGKRPLKKDLKPLEVNALFKTAAYKEDDTILEIAAYITNVMLNAGAGAHKTDITFKTLIKNCPRLRERLDAIESIPKGAQQENGKRINKTARYNSELRKIARAYSLIMSPDKCDALHYFSFDSFMPTKETKGGREFVPPTKSTMDGKISIKWHRIDPETPK